MKTTFLTALAVTAMSAQALSDEQLNVVDRTIKCNDDYECTPAKLSYLIGAGKPVSQNDVCCATFPYETWNGFEYEKSSEKLCYSKKILNNSSGFNYYKQAYCDGALSGMALAFGASVTLALLAF